MTADGFSLDDKRQPIDDNDIPDIVARWEKSDIEADRKRTEKSFMVPKEEIKENGYDLSLNRYKEIVYEEVKYDPPAVILERVEALELEILKGINQLREMIK